MKLRQIKKILKKVWHFLVHEESWASFLADAIIIILVAKFVVYPAIGLALGTSYPLVAVVSSSMDHGGQDFENWWSSYGDWYEQHNISDEQFQNYYLNNGFKKGDVLVIKGAPIADLRAGDTIIYKVTGKKDPIIHRIIAINISDSEIAISTKGDANSGQLEFEKSVLPDQIRGKGVALIPKIGWFKVAFIELFKKLK